MLFNSLDFAVFLPIVFILYWFIFSKNLRLQNFFIVLASYIFYGWWDWRFLALIFFSTLIDFVIGLKLRDVQSLSSSKILLGISIAVNLGLLGFFKYFNFFIENFILAFSFLGYNLPSSSLNIILPVGISFYTFQTLSYTIDVYNRKLEPTSDFIAFAGFISFFPQLVAGPIERAKDLLPQFFQNRKFDYAKAVDGSRQILWGLFKKIVIADNCAVHVNQIFNNSESYTGSTLFIGMLLFTFQIYSDFSGYSDIAIGTARLLGFNLSQNFAFPFFSRNFKEFWRRWHISLTLWLRDYLYIPMGGNQGSLFKKLKNVLIIFTLVGFWHGANWTFIVFGVIHAVFYLPFIIVKNKVSITNTIGHGKFIPSRYEFVFMLITFLFFSFSLVLFRADNLSHAFNFYSDLLKNPGSFLLINNYLNYQKIINLIFLFILVEWIGRNQKYALERLNSKFSKSIRFFIYYLIISFIVLFGGKGNEFIYFNF